MNGTAAVGTDNSLYARGDHVHPSDTAKLDAASYTAADVLTKIKTVDGAGSGLDADLLDGVDAVVLAPPGGVTAFAGTAIPTGWLNCDGSAVNRATYAALFTAIGTTWGAGDGSTTFNIPDLRGATIRGVGVSTLYTQNVTITLAQTINDTVQEHTHVTNDPGHNHTQNAHNHTITDPGHTHIPYVPQADGNDHTLSSTGSSGMGSGGLTSSSTTGITLATATATNNAATTGYTVAQMAVYGANGTPRTGTETTAKARGLYWIIKY
jgi:microcystin-dependent protein